MLDIISIFIFQIGGINSHFLNLNILFNFKNDKLGTVGNLTETYEFYDLYLLWGKINIIYSDN